MYTFSVITSSSIGRLFGSIHTRVPVILETDEAIARWLNPNTTQEEALEMLHPPSDQALAWYPVSTTVNSTRNDTPECMIPLKQNVRQGEIQAAKDRS